MRHLSGAEHIIGCLLVNPELAIRIPESAASRLRNEVNRLTESNPGILIRHFDDRVREMEAHWDDTTPRPGIHESISRLRQQREENQ
jgi:hypothetical protein